MSYTRPLFLRPLRPHKSRSRILSSRSSFRRRRLRRPLFRVPDLDLADGRRVDGQVGIARDLRWMRRSRRLRRAHGLRLHRRSFARAHSARRAHGSAHCQRPAKTTVTGFQQKPARSLYPVPLPSVDAEISAKVDLLMRGDRTARAFDPRIKEVRPATPTNSATFSSLAPTAHLPRTRSHSRA